MLTFSKILIIDQDKLVLKLLKARFSHAGYRVQVAESEDEAKTAIENRSPAAILCNDIIAMKDGFSFLSFLKEAEGSRGIPFFILSSEKSICDSFLALDVKNMFEWPYNGDRIVGSVKNILLNKLIRAKIKDKDFLEDSAGDLQNKIKRILLCEGKNEIVRQIYGSLGRGHRILELAEYKDDILKSAFELEPDIVLINVGLENFSAKYIVLKLNELFYFNATVLLYMNFQRRDSADNSDLHYYYLNFLDEIASQVRFPLYYIGVYDSETFADSVEMYLK